MNDKIQGIVIQSLRYGDTSLIVKVLTRNYGLQSYMVKGAFNRISKNKAGFFQDLNLIQYVETGHSDRQALGYLKDVQLSFIYQSIPFVMNKSAILLFISELLSKTITEQERNEALFDFITHSMQWLDLVEHDYANFPLFFSLELTRHLGFYPKANYTNGACFDMMQGMFVHDYPLHPYFFDAVASSLFSFLINVPIEEACHVPIKVNQRRELLNGLIDYIRLHASTMKDFHSHEVLKTVLE